MTLVLGAASACKGPVELTCEEDPLQCSSVSSIAVSSAIDTVLAIGGSTTLSAAAMDANGNAVSTAFSWASSDPTTATVGASTGTIAALTPGSATMSATSQGTTGSLGIRVVDADLPAVDALTSDAYFASLVGGLDPTTASALNAVLALCDASVASGNVLAVNQCLTDGLASTGANGTDTALLAVLGLFLAEGQRLLELSP